MIQIELTVAFSQMNWTCYPTTNYKTNRSSKNKAALANFQTPSSPAHNVTLLLILQEGVYPRIINPRLTTNNNNYQNRIPLLPLLSFCIRGFWWLTPLTIMIQAILQQTMASTWRSFQTICLRMNQMSTQQVLVFYAQISFLTTPLSVQL